MGKVKIITDSTAYLPNDTIKQYGDFLDIVPLSVIFPEITLTDGLSIQGKFLELLRTSPTTPSTSQPTPAAFQRAFEAALAEGQEIVVLTISGKLSGTYASAVIAVRQLNSDKITVLDSRTTAAGLAMLVEEALRAAKGGADRQEIVALLNGLIPTSRTFFVPDTLEYLRKGGRIGGASALLGSLLQIKPVLQIREGQVDVLDKVRTRQKASQRVLDELPGRYNGRVGLIHVAALERVQELVPLVLERAPEATINFYEAGPVIATHAGPGTFGLSFFAF